MQNKLVFAVLMAFCSSALSCKMVVPAPTSEARFAAAKNVYSAYISSVALDVGDESMQDEPEGMVRVFLGAPERLRLVIVKTLKGTPAEVKIVPWRFCGSGTDRLGSRVTAYEYDHQWYLDDGRPAGGNFTQEELNRLPREPEPAR